jgi:hypothetical protein
MVQPWRPARWYSGADAVPDRDIVALERVQDGSAVDAVPTSKLVHASAGLVALANLRYLGGGEAPLVAALALRANNSRACCVRHDLPGLVVQTNQRCRLVRESFCQDHHYGSRSLLPLRVTARSDASVCLIPFCDAACRPFGGQGCPPFGPEERPTEWHHPAQCTVRLLATVSKTGAMH